MQIGFSDGRAWIWIGMGILITMVPLVSIGLIARKYFRKTYFEICGLDPDIPCHWHPCRQCKAGH